MVFHELNRQRVNNPPEHIAIHPEKTVLLEKHGVERKGRFDFLVQTKDKTIGIEVLTRPSQGKMKEKLAYANEVDEFIFVIPSQSMGLYRKHKTNGLKSIAHKKFLDKEFNEPKLRVWMIDCSQGKIEEKGPFSKIFEVQR